MKKILLVLIGAMFLANCKKLDENRELPSSASKASVREDKLFEVPTNIPKYKEGELLVKFKNNNQRAAIGKMNYELVRTKAMERFNDNGFYRVNVGDVEKEMARLKSSPEVEWVSPNWTETISQFNDPLLPQLYGMQNIFAPAAWNSGNVGRQDVYVGVIDEGSMYWHCDLYENIWENTEEMNGTPGVDDDNNGYIDDFRGWNWFNGNNQIYQGNDDHGTHVAGTIAGKGNNGIGVVGVAPNVKIISLKFLADYGFDSHAIQAIDYAIDLKLRKGLNIKVLSNSWGGGGFNQGLIDAINRAKAADILFICAAGNADNNNDVNPSASYPSSYPNDNIIAVGASGGGNLKSYFSSYGKTTVDLFAPGENITSTLPTSTHTPGYGSYSGTSMATPHVSGGIALLASVNPEWGWAQLKSTLLSTVTPVASLANICVTGGVMNVSTFTGSTPPIVPNADCGTPPPGMDITPPTPMILTLDSTQEDIVSGRAIIYLSWIKSTDANPIPYLVFQLTPFWSWGFEGNAWSGYAFNVPMNALYQISGRARDSWGNYSEQSNVITVDYSGAPPPTDNIPPSLPTNLRASNIQKLSFNLAWTASTDNVAVQKYKVLWKKVGQDTWAQTFTNNNTPSYTVNVFTEADTEYECGIIAYDAAGNTSDTSATIFVRTLPDIPPPPPSNCSITSNLNATSQSLSVTLSWTTNVTGDCTTSSTRLERRKSNGVYSVVAFDPASPYVNNVPTPGNYTYRLAIQSSTGQTFYSNEKSIKVNKK